jgi:hypothetical protein
MAKRATHRFGVDGAGWQHDQSVGALRVAMQRQAA